MGAQKATRKVHNNPRTSFLPILALALAFVPIPRMRITPDTAPSLIREALTFARKHPVFISIIVWMGIVPRSIMDAVRLLLEQNGRLPWALTIAIALLDLLLAYWSLAAVLMIGKRMYKQRAGRGRTSLVSVLRESRMLLLPLVFTSFLRACVTVYWALLFLIPGIVYFLKTAFYAIAMAMDDLQYRSALHHSHALVTGRFWNVTGTLAILALILLVPAEAAFFGLDLLLSPLGLLAEAAAILIGNTLEQAALLVLILSMIAYYQRLTHAKAAADAYRLHNEGA